MCMYIYIYVYKRIHIELNVKRMYASLVVAMYISVVHVYCMWRLIRSRSDFRGMLEFTGLAKQGSYVWGSNSRA